MNDHHHTAFLADHPNAFPIVSAWLYEEWFRELDLSPSETEDKIRSWMSTEEVPLGLLGLVGSEPVGVVSIIEDDEPVSPQTAYYLNALYVAPAWRRRGVGKMLCRRAQAEARRLGLPTLSLYAGDAESYYHRLGWQKVADTVIEQGAGIELVAFMRERDSSPSSDFV